MNTVLITGSSKGLGAALAEVFSENKYDIVLHGRDVGNIKSIQNIVEGNGVKVYFVNGDLQDEGVIEDLARCAICHGVDIVINNAGAYLKKSFLDMSIKEFKDVINTNLIAPVSVTHKIFKYFKEKGRGVVININSVAGKVGSDGEIAYCSSKFGLRGFGESLQFEATKYGIQVTDVYLGAMKTDMTCNRDNRDLFISTAEAADMIFSLVQKKSTMRVGNISLGRLKY